MTRPPTTVIGMLRRTLREEPDGVAVEVLERPQQSGTVVHRHALWREAARLAFALHRSGLQAAENVLFLSENGPRWATTDLALLGLGAPSVPRGLDSPPEEVDYLVRKVSARFAVVERASALQRLPPASVGAQSVIVLEDGDDEVLSTLPGAEGRSVQRYSALIDSTDDSEALEFFEARCASRRADEIATLVFTSGTSGRPKGVMLTQANLAHNLTQILAVIDFLAGSERFLSVLPPWHMFERLVEYALLTLRLRIVYTDRRNFARDLAAVRPDVLAAVPRIWMALMDAVLHEVRRAPAWKRALFRAACQIRVAHRRGLRWLRDEESAGAASGWSARLRRALRGTALLSLAPLDRCAHALVMGPAARRIGIDRLARGAGISGGGATPEHVCTFIEALGVRHLDGYGLTETSPVLAVRLPSHNVLGSVGPPLPGTQVRLRHPEHGGLVDGSEQGVLHVRGPQVMRGYHDDPEATARVLREDGWFDTGDLCRISARGELTITGRAKDTIVLLSGENVEPEPLENALLQSKWIQQVVVVGQDQKFLAALIVPTELASSEKRLKDPDVLASLRKEIDHFVNVRRGFRPHERIVRFRLLDQPFSHEDGSMSTTLKLKRSVIQERCAQDIAALFVDES